MNCGGPWRPRWPVWLFWPKLDLELKKSSKASKLWSSSLGPPMKETQVFFKVYYWIDNYERYDAINFNNLLVCTVLCGCVFNDDTIYNISVFDWYVFLVNKLATLCAFKYTHIKGLVNMMILRLRYAFVISTQLTCINECDWKSFLLPSRKIKSESAQRE